MSLNEYKVVSYAAVGCTALGKIVVCFCQVLFSLGFVNCKN